jgi:alpha-L-arabinofuranosidase
VHLVIINMSETEAFETAMVGAGGIVQVFTIGGRDITVTNMDGKDEMGVKEGDWDEKGKYSFGKHSMTMMRWKA